MIEARYSVTVADCNCEYPCSCVEFRGKKYGDKNEVIEDLAKTLDRVADKLDETVSAMMDNDD